MVCFYRTLGKRREISGREKQASMVEFLPFHGERTITIEERKLSGRTRERLRGNPVAQADGQPSIRHRIARFLSRQDSKNIGYRGAPELFARLDRIPRGVGCDDHILELQKFLRNL